MKLLRDNWKGILSIILLLIIFSLVVKSCNNAKEKKAINKEQEYRDSVQKAIDERNKSKAEKDQAIRNYLDCARENDSLTKVAATKIDIESVQREKDITTRVIPDVELQRQMSDFYRKSAR